VRDAVALEKRGIPTLSVVQDRFEREARAIARMMGMEDLPLLIEPSADAGYMGSRDASKLLQERRAEVLRALTAPLRREAIY